MSEGIDPKKFVAFIRGLKRGNQTSSRPAKPKQPAKQKKVSPATSSTRPSHNPPAKPTATSPPPSPTNPPPPQNLLPGLHISAVDLAGGLEYAASLLKEAPPLQSSGLLGGARNLLGTAYGAYCGAHPQNGSHDIDEIVLALNSGSWLPSVGDLLRAGLSPNGLAFMPEGNVVLQMPGERNKQPVEVAIRSTDLGRALSRLSSLSLPDRKEMLSAVSGLLDEFPGAVVQEWCASVELAQHKHSHRPHKQANQNR